MVNNVLALTASGVRDWLVQRVTALMIFFYVLGTTAYVGMHSPLTYEAWHALFACQKRLRNSYDFLAVFLSQ